MSKKKDEPTFEHGLARLEDLIGTLEDGDVGLEKQLAVFEEGIKLSRMLNRKLDQAEKRLEVLLKDENGDLKAQEFSLESDDE